MLIQVRGEGRGGGIGGTCKKRNWGGDTLGGSRHYAHTPPPHPRPHPPHPPHTLGGTPTSPSLHTLHKHRGGGVPSCPRPPARRLT